MNKISGAKHYRLWTVDSRPIILVLILLSAFSFQLSAQQAYAETCSSISQYGITWTFDRPYQCGQFVNGDWWVVPNEVGGNVTIVSKTPTPTGTGATYRHGSMVNPVPATANAQAYDGRAVAFNQNIAVSFPRILKANDSLISTISRPEDTDFSGSRHQGRISDAAILTCLAEQPPADAFRPPYCGTSKPIHRVSDMDLTLLPNLSSVTGTPEIESFYNGTIPVATTGIVNFRKPWIDHVIDWMGRHIHPSNHMPDYGREISRYIGDASLMLTLRDVGNRTDLAIYMTQLGIDLYGIAEAGGYWPASGGHDSGRKLPILLAGLVLDDENMLNVDSIPTVHFQEDDQTFYVTQADVGRQLDVMLSGIATSASVNTIGVSGVPSWLSPTPFVDNYIKIVSGTGVGQRRYVTATTVPRAGGAGVLTVSPAWDVTPSTVDSVYQVEGYEEGHIGMVEWGIGHVQVPRKDNPAWYADYRQCCNAYAWGGYVLAARIFDLVDIWNHDALFDYQDLYVEITAPEGTYPGWHFQSLFAENMWDTYRPLYDDTTVLYGDVSGNGTISSSDAALVARYVVGLETFTDEQKTKADVSGNGSISSTDAALIAQRAVGLIDVFPVENQP